MAIFVNTSRQRNISTVIVVPVGSIIILASVANFGDLFGQVITTKFCKLTRDFCE